ncbi:MAG: hypothetical protein ABIH28_03325 [archaeon]
MAIEIKQKNWFKRHWIVSIILGILILGAIGSMFEETESTQGKVKLLNSTNDQKDTESIILKKEPLDLLPTREEIDTEWENIKTKERIIEEQGFVSGASLDMDRMESVSLSTAYIFIAKFESKNYAESFYSTSVSKVKEGGGYTETSTSGIDASCFGYKGGDLYEGYYYTFYCKKENIFFLTEVATFSAGRSGYSKELAKIVGDKV